MPCCRYITQQELASLSSYMTARLSLDKVCLHDSTHLKQPEWRIQWYKAACNLQDHRANSGRLCRGSRLPLLSLSEPAQVLCMHRSPFS